MEVSAINRDGDFFELGGHSLLLVKVAAGIRAGTGLEVGRNRGAKNHDSHSQRNRFKIVGR